MRAIAGLVRASLSLGVAALLASSALTQAGAQEAGPAAPQPTVDSPASAGAPVAPEASTAAAPVQQQGAPVSQSAAPEAAPAEQAAAAAPVEPVPSAYMTGLVRVREAEMDAWLAKPDTLFTTYPDAGIPMSNQVRMLGGSDSRSIVPLIALAARPEATGPQVAAIGSGLARTAQGGQVSAPLYAAYIQVQVAASQNPRLIAAFTTALADQAVAALGAGGSPGAGGGAGSVTGGGDGGTVNGNPNAPIPQAFSSLRAAQSVIYVNDNNGNNNNSLPSVGGGGDASPAQ